MCRVCTQGLVCETFCVLASDLVFPGSSSLGQAGSILTPTAHSSPQAAVLPSPCSAVASLRATLLQTHWWPCPLSGLVESMWPCVGSSVSCPTSGSGWCACASLANSLGTSACSASAGASALACQSPQPMKPNMLPYPAVSPCSRHAESTGMKWPTVEGAVLVGTEAWLCPYRLNSTFHSSTQPGSGLAHWESL